MHCALFTEWFIFKNYEPEVVGIDATSLGMGTVYQYFYEECLDEIKITESEPVVDLEKIDCNQQKLVVLWQGMPGLGKNYIGERVSDMLCRNGIISQWMDQDSFVKDHGNKAGAVALKHFSDLLGDPFNEVVMVLRNNADESQYRKYINTAKEFDWQIMMLYPSEIVDTTDRARLVATCMSAVINRTDHPTFDTITKAKRAMLVTAFAQLLFGDYLGGPRGH